MKYIPGSAKIKLNKFTEQKPRNVYVVDVECDANDGDYMNESFETDEFSELDILMYAYLQLDPYSIPKNWKASKDAYKRDCNWAFGGKYPAENSRFDPENWGNGRYSYESWLESYASSNNLLIYAGMCDQSCHTIECIDVTYYDENGKSFSCEFPDLGELFDSEEEFITYIQQLDKDND